ncbi:hypothetical protein ACFQ80_07125 [Isoptericola sp. NPDC056578]|uniref:hypothetical protein n=1 Tax=Isoptericola sp. NPDC056578 TaxID=3345870 RepID=UPI003690A6A9
MAYIKSISRLAPIEGAHRSHSETECTWRESTREGRKVLQLDTYGSRQRRDVGTISQSIQLDEQAAAELLDVIGQVFPALARQDAE